MRSMLFRYGLTLLQLQFGMYACFDVKMKYPWTQTAGALVCMAAALISEPAGIWSLVIADATAGIVAWMSVRYKKKMTAYQFLGTLIIWIGLTELIDVPRSLCQILNGREVHRTLVMVLVGVLLYCLILGGAAAARKKWMKKYREQVYEKIRNRMSAMLVIVVMNLFVLIFALGLPMDRMQEKTFEIMLIFLKVISLLNVSFLICFVLYLWETDRKLDLLNRQKETYRRAEKLHYEMLLKREEETGKYRHDMKNHLVCMEQLAQKGAWEELKKYLSGMTEQVQHLTSAYETGNRILDIVTNYLLSGEDLNADIRIYGGVRIAEGIRQEDLCTIYGNLLQNAVEELKRMKRDERGFLNIRLFADTNFFQMEMENSLAGAKPDLLTHKVDRNRHGFGIGNVRETVEKNGGEMRMEIRDTSFYVSVILPLDYRSAN